MGSLQIITKIKNEIDEAETTLIALKERKKIIKESLKNGFGVSTLEKARAKQKQMENELEKMEQEMETLIQEIEEKYNG